MGEWKNRNITWYDQSMMYCVCCGLMIPKQYWKVEISGEPQIFCKPNCERLYREYVQPKETGSV